MSKSLLSLVVAVLFVLGFTAVNSIAGLAPPLGDGSGCSALTSPDIVCDDLNIISLGPQAFCGTMGEKAIEVTSHNDADTDGTSDAIEKCICDALDRNPNLNLVRPGNRSVCDSRKRADPLENKDQFDVTCFDVGPINPGAKKHGFCCTFNSFPEDICPQANG